jgi:hypothetical protein
MADILAPSKTITFTINKTPARLADRKTIQRLMRMQRPIQDALRRLSKVRRQERNHRRQRAGRMWMVRVPMTKVTRVEKGETFTLKVTPQIMRDVQAVSKYLDMKSA